MNRLEDTAETLARLNEMGQIASGVGHHVINAFSAIVSNAELLRLIGHSDSPLDPQIVVDTILRTAIDASTVARRMIDYSRTATGVGTAMIALDQIAADTCERHRSADATHEIDWRLDLETVPEITGDADQIAHMLDLLIANAREALPRAGGIISLKSYVDDRGWIALEVGDDGSGMSPEIAERAVEPFFTTKPGRFGIGLSIANGIWRRHRGALAILSSPGEGTSVQCRIDPKRGADVIGPRQP